MSTCESIEIFAMLALALSAGLSVGMIWAFSSVKQELDRKKDEEKNTALIVRVIGGSGNYYVVQRMSDKKILQPSGDFARNVYTAAQFPNVDRAVEAGVKVHFQTFYQPL